MARFHGRDSHSSGVPVARHLTQPTRTAGLETGLARRPCCPYSVLLPVGFTMPPLLPVARWALTPPFHPYPGWIFRFDRSGLLSVALSLRSPSPGVTRHRVPMEPGLSSPAAFRRLRQRLSGRLAPADLSAFSGKVKRLYLALPLFPLKLMTLSNGGRPCPARSGGAYRVSKPARAGSPLARDPDPRQSVVPFHVAHPDPGSFNLTVQPAQSSTRPSRQSFRLAATPKTGFHDFLSTWKNRRFWRFSS